MIKFWHNNIFLGLTIDKLAPAPYQGRFLTKYEFLRVRLMRILYSLWIWQGRLFDEILKYFKIFSVGPLRNLPLQLIRIGCMMFLTKYELFRVRPMRILHSLWKWQRRLYDEFLKYFKIFSVGPLRTLHLVPYRNRLGDQFDKVWII